MQGSQRLQEWISTGEMRPLAEHHSLHALDLLGFGRSEKPRDTDYPIALQADLCIALLDDCGVGHYPQLEAPDLVVDAYEAFRARVDGALSRT